MTGSASRGVWQAADGELRRFGPARTALLMALLGLAVRAVALVLRGTPPDGDERVYLALAENLAHHGRFSIASDGPLEGHFGPLYPLLLALPVLLGVSSLHAGWIVSILAGSVAVGLVTILGVRVWTRPLAATAAALAAALHPAMITASRQIYTESLSSVFLLLSVLALTAPRRRGALCGLALGLAALTRREAVFLVPVMLLFLLFSSAPEGRSRPARPRIREAAALLVAFLLLFGPYLLYLRQVAGRWTLSNRTNYSWIVGRLMEERPGEGLPLEEIRSLEITYPTPLAWYRARPGKTTSGLVRSAWLHLRLAFTGDRSWPIGTLAIVGLASALAAGRLRAWPPAAWLLPFFLVFVWSTAGPIVRYPRALAPFICLLVGGALPSAPGRREAEAPAGEGLS